MTDGTHNVVALTLQSWLHTVGNIDVFDDDAACGASKLHCSDVNPDVVRAMQRVGAHGRRQISNALNGHPVDRDGNWPNHRWLDTIQFELQTRAVIPPAAHVAECDVAQEIMLAAAMPRFRAAVGLDVTATSRSLGVSKTVLLSTGKRLLRERGVLTCQLAEQCQMCAGTDNPQPVHCLH